MASQNDIAAAEAEFKKKFGGMGMKPRMGPGGSMRPGAGMNSVLAKRLQGGGQKWFDSGDYNMNKNKSQPNVPSPIYKAPPTGPAANNGSGEGQKQENLPNPAFKQPTLPTGQLNQSQGMMTSPTKSKLAD